MTKETKTLPIKSKEDRISDEYADLKSMFTGMSSDINKQAIRLCKEAAFLRVMMADLKEILNRDEYEETNHDETMQSGFTRSIACNQYGRTLTSYLRVMASINKLLSGKPKRETKILSFVIGES